MEGQRYIIDRVGEETDLANCSVCHAISCFSSVQDHCTALEKAADGGCVFYKDAEDNRREIRRCFYRLIRHERFDLLEKYADTLAALGFMDEEMADAARQHDDLEKYRTTHYNLLLSSGWKETLTVVRPSGNSRTPRGMGSAADSRACLYSSGPLQEIDRKRRHAVFLLRL